MRKPEGGDVTSDDCAGGDCPEALARLEGYLDGELDEDELADVSHHLSDCYPCGDRAEFERHLRHVVREHASDESAPVDLLERVKKRCREESEWSSA
jgi:mycothiol system anti-sigma-R factor